MKDVLKRLRMENRYSQELLAKILGISRQSYTKYETGEVEPSVEIVRRLSRIYKVSYEYLINNGTEDFSLFEYRQNSDPTRIAEPCVSYEADLHAVSFDSSKILEGMGEIKKMLEFFSTNRHGVSILTETKNKDSTFDKKAFFEEIGEVHIDTLSVDKLREESVL